MNIFKQIKNSVYGKEYYNSTVLTESTGQSVKYLAKLSLLLATIGLVILACFLPLISNKIKTSLTAAIATYPDDLVITIKNGLASTNQPEPYFIKTPDSLKTTNPKVTIPDNLITINTTETLSLDKFKEYSTYVLLTGKDLVTVDGNNGNLKITPLSNWGNVEISKSWLYQKEATFIKFLPLFAFFFLILFFGIFFAIEFVGTLIILFFYALVAKLVLKTRNIDLSYKKSYQVALHASTAVLILSILFKMLNMDNIWLKVIILSIVVYFNFDKISTPTEKEGIVIETPTVDVTPQV